MLLFMIRGNTIKFSSSKKKQQDEENIKLEQEIRILENKVNMFEESLNNLGNKNNFPRTNCQYTMLFYYDIEDATKDNHNFVLSRKG